MDEEYDVIILGTGLTECLLSGVLSVEGKKVLHMDRNDYYGGESASLNLTRLFEKHQSKTASAAGKPPETLGRDRDWSVDLISKFLMANGDLTGILVHTDVIRYLEFKQIAGSYVFRDGRIAKVPANESEAIRSSLMGIFEKRRMRNFMLFVGNYKDEDPATHQGLNVDSNTMEEVYAKFGLEPGTKDFIGHAMALYLDDSYLRKPAREAIERIYLYSTSVARYGKSPYIYPLYGLGELPQGFARLSAIYGGTYMLDKSIDEIIYEDGKAVGVKSGDEVVKAKKVIGDPTYFPGKIRKTGSVIRAICLLAHPIPNTDNADSLQLIIPSRQVGRKNDIYIAMVGWGHNVASKNHYIATVSTIVETSNPHIEIEAGLKLLGPVLEKFMEVKDLYEPLNDGRSDNVFISKSYDATSHFETTTEEVREIYRRVEGNDLVLTKRLTMEEEANIAAQ